MVLTGNVVSQILFVHNLWHCEALKAMMNPIMETISNFDIVISNEVDRRIFSKQKSFFSFIHSQVVSRPKFEVGMHILKYSSSYAHFNLFSDESEIECPW